jgi:hypothetical protein
MLRTEFRSRIGEVEAHTEHQQSIADLGKLLRDGKIGHESGAERAMIMPAMRVSDDGRQLQPARE